MKNDVSKMGK